jgi:hypothetical protein
MGREFPGLNKFPIIPPYHPWVVLRATLLSAILITATSFARSDSPGDLVDTRRFEHHSRNWNMAPDVMIMKISFSSGGRLLDPEPYFC